MDWPGLVFAVWGCGWIEATLLVCLFWAALARPERIRSPFKFRLAGMLLATAIGAHAVIQIIVFGYWMPRIIRGANHHDDLPFMLVASTFPSIISMLAVFLGIGSVLPQPQREVGK